MNNHEEEQIVVTENEIADFLDFIDSHDDYLDDGMGVFHTDNHSNW